MSCADLTTGGGEVRRRSSSGPASRTFWLALGDGDGDQSRRRGGRRGSRAWAAGVKPLRQAADVCEQHQVGRTRRVGCVVSAPGEY
jgi:hypothetical protein